MIGLQHDAILSRFPFAKIEKNQGNNKKTQKFCGFCKKISIFAMEKDTRGQVPCVASQL